MVRGRDELALQGGPGDDVLTGTWDQDTLWGLGGDDTLRGEGGPDTLAGHEGNDLLYGGDDLDVLDGGSGNDLLYGGAGDDTLREPDGGDGEMWGEAGDDTIEVSRDGLAAASARLLLSGGIGNDVIRAGFGQLSALEPFSMVSVDGGDGDDLVRVTGHVGSTVTLGAGNDFLTVGGAGEHVIQLGAGNDTLTLNGGLVIPVRVKDFQAGDDGDRIDLARSLQMSGISYEPEINPFHTGHAVLEQHGADVWVRWSGKTRIILENVQIAALTATNLGGMLPGTGATITGGHIYGSVRTEQIIGSMGADVMYGDGGSDQLFGYEGNDVLHGGVGDDDLDGGAGNDVVHGGQGHDVVNEGGGFGAGGDDVYFGEGGDDRVVVNRTNGANSHVTVWGGAGDDSAGNSTYWATSGPVGRLTFHGEDGDDGMGTVNVDHWTFDGGMGDDGVYIDGVYRGAEVFIGEGVFNGGAGLDTVTLGGHAAHLEIVVVDENTFRIGNAVVHDVEGFWIVGQDVTRDFSAMLRGLTIRTIEGDDVLTGTAFDDVLVSSEGQDVMDGGAGYDTAVFTHGFADYEMTTVGGVTTLQHRMAGAAYSLDTLRNIERLEFADGWYGVDGQRLASIVYGTAGVDHIAGKAFSDTVLAGDGDDVIRTTTGSDVIDGGAGHDIVYAGFSQSFYKILAVGDDFLLKGPDGATLLKNVEMVQFRDGTAVELNRLYEAGPGKDDAVPHVMPGREAGGPSPEVQWGGPDLLGDAVKLTDPLTLHRPEDFF